ncbi:MAG: hypothetical protein PHQ35_02290 [Phycisphaerae bacterium]|nr:hypothetical protein [Phycisphaerae bacterium]MDD5380474.1 hypothetical protein [Phycisphaerae bacterium]
MATLFSSYFDIDSKKLKKLGVFNPVIGVDTRLFLDPHLLKNSRIKEFKNSRKKIKKYYEDIIRLLLAHRERNDRAWKEAFKRLKFKETKGVFIGYGVHGGDGNAIGPGLARRLINTATEIINMGIRDPEIFELIGLFEEDFGADRLSDMAIAIIKKDVCKYTQRITKKLGITDVTNLELLDKTYIVPKHPYANKPLLLLPEGLLRDLPVALTWEGIDHVVATNSALREKLNRLIGRVWKNKIKKRDLRNLILTDKTNIKTLVEAYKKSTTRAYDFEKDPAGEVSWYSIGERFALNNPFHLQIPRKAYVEDLEKVVRELINQFKRNIEVNGLNELLYTKEGFRLKPRHERFSQRLFYATADTYCEANNLDLSREPNAGSGPVDFKLSYGRRFRVLVEIKLSSNTRLIHGFQKQLPAYQKSENVMRGFYVVIRVTRSESQINKLIKLRNSVVDKNKNLPEIIVIDALYKLPASRK